jgi:hypothetical protein
MQSTKLYHLGRTACMRAAAGTAVEHTERLQGHRQMGMLAAESRQKPLGPKKARCALNTLLWEGRGN